MNASQADLHRFNPFYENTGSLARFGRYLRIKRFDVQTEFWLRCLIVWSGLFLQFVEFGNGF